MKKTFFALCTALTLGACGSNSSPALIGQQLSRALARPPSVDLRTTLTPEFLAQVGQPVLFVELPQRRAQAGTLLSQQDGTRQIWTSLDGIAVTLQSGILTETRGLGGDLMTTDLGNVTAAMRGETDSAVRIHRYLNGEDGIDALAFVCTYSRQNDVAVATLAGNFRTLRLTENCTGPTITFENHYWLGRSGLPIKSVQWVGPNVGYAEIEQTTAQ